MLKVKQVDVRAAKALSDNIAAQLGEAANIIFDPDNGPTVQAFAKHREDTALPLREVLAQIDGEAPDKEPRDGPTVGFQPSSDPEQDDGNDVVEEAFREGVVRGLWEAANMARKALHPDTTGGE